MAEVATTNRPRTEAERTSHRFLANGPAIAGWALPFALVLYLALKGGGYDAVLRSEVGIAVWWIVLVGAAAGVLPAHRISTAGWCLISALGAFAVWTALGIGWSESAERSAAELARVATLLGVLAFAVAAQGRDGLRRTVGAVAAAIGLVSLLALLSRLQPGWFPVNETAEALPASQARLSYPLGYWNGLAAFVAMGIPLAAVSAVRARALAVEALAVASLPVLALTMYLTLSRGGVLELAAGLLVLFALHPLRARIASVLALGGIGAAILIAAASQRAELMDGLDSSAAWAQGDEMLAIVIVVCAGVALLQVAVGLLFRYSEGPSLRMPLRLPRSKGAVLAVVVAAIGVALIAGLPGAISDGWENFKEPAVPEASADRFDSSSGSGRYQWWSSSIDAGASEPLTGIGPGTFEFWWAREGTIPGFTREAHSLYLEVFAELGIVGLITIVALVGGIVLLGVRRARASTGAQRELAAGATASCVIFAVAAGIDWSWELTLIPVTFFLLAAALAQADASADKASSRVPRAALAGLSALALVAIALPLASTASVRSSEEQLEAQQLGPALEEAQAAGDVQPFAASPAIQEALVLESAGDLDGAASAAAEATREEPTNWRTWFVLSRVEAQRGNAAASVDAYRRARELNPRSPLFQ